MVSWTLVTLMALDTFGKGVLPYGDEMAYRAL